MLMSQYQSYNRPQIIESNPILNESKKKKRSLLFDRVQTDQKISDFRKYINKNVNIYHIDQHKRTILMFTAQNYHFEVLTYLINNYPKLILKIDNKDMNIMHYIASSRIDDNQMVSLITNKKFTYNKLIWCRDINGNLPKDISKQYNNKQITKSFEKMMHDTWEQYHHIARHNNNIQLEQIKTINNNNNINDHDTYCEDMDMDNMNRINSIEIESELKQQERSLSPPNVPYRSIVICARKRTRQTLTIENDDLENYYPSIPDRILIDVNHNNNNNNNCNKRRKLNEGNYLRTTPTQPNISPSPLPPLPPIQLTPFELNSSSNNSPCTIFGNCNNINNNNSYLSSDNSSTHSSLFHDTNLPNTFLSFTNGRSVIPKLIRSRAVDNTSVNTCVNSVNIYNDNSKYQIIGRNYKREMEEISRLYYNGEKITKQQFMFIKWYKKRIGNMSYLSVIINKGYDNLNKFMTLNKQMCIQLFGNGIFDNYNNNNNKTEMDMNRFSDRIRELQLSPLSTPLSTPLSIRSNNSESINHSMRDLSIGENINRNDINIVRNHLISDSVINSSDSISCDDIFTNHNKKINNVISFPWACGQCDVSEDDDL